MRGTSNYRATKSKKVSFQDIFVQDHQTQYENQTEISNLPASCLCLEGQGAVTVDLIQSDSKVSI